MTARINPTHVSNELSGVFLGEVRRVMRSLATEKDPERRAKLGADLVAASENANHWLQNDVVLAGIKRTNTR